MIKNIKLGMKKTSKNESIFVIIMSILAAGEIYDHLSFVDHDSFILSAIINIGMAYIFFLIYSYIRGVYHENK